MSWTDITSANQCRGKLGIAPFQQRFPWIGGDLQTLRDTFRTEELPLDQGEIIQIPIPPSPSGICGSGYLLGLLEGYVIFI